MTKWILALFCAALTGTAWAQQYDYPMPTPITPVSGVSGVQPKPEPIPAPVPIPPAQPGMGAPGAMIGTSCGNGGCASGCCQATKKVCMPEPSIKVKVSIKYSSVCEDKCWRTCFWPFGNNNCDSCSSCASGHSPRPTDSPNCNSHPYVKKYLVKRIVTEDIPITKCVAREVPACGGGFCPAQCGEWQYPTQPGVIRPGPVGPIPEPIPGPMPSKTR